MKLCGWGSYGYYTCVQGLYSEISNLNEIQKDLLYGGPRERKEQNGDWEQKLKGRQTDKAVTRRQQTSQNLGETCTKAEAEKRDVERIKNREGMGKQILSIQHEKK